MFRVKHMLQRCVYAMLLHQELSAPQVISYLMDYNNHFTSHKFISFNWSIPELYVNQTMPLDHVVSSRSTNMSDPSVDVDNSDPVPVLPSSPAFDIPPDHYDVSDVSDADRIGSVPDEPEVSTIPVSDDGDVILQLDSANNLVVRPSLLENYLLRSSELEDVCLWDYMSRVEKVSKVADKKKHRWRRSHDDDDLCSGNDLDLGDGNADIADDSGADESEDDEPPDCASVPSLWDLHIHGNKHLLSTRQKRPRIDFATSHPEYSIHYQQVRKHDMHLVPVPLRASIPRRDRADTKERHTRLMLILLKPWTDFHNLKPVNTSWLEAYNTFVATSQPRFIALINNMQILHECRDSRNDHFTKHNVERCAEARRAGRSDNNAGGSHADTDGLDEDDVLAHLRDIDVSWSDKNEKCSAMVKECLEHARASGLISDS